MSLKTQQERARKALLDLCPTVNCVACGKDGQVIDSIVARTRKETLDEVEAGMMRGNAGIDKLPLNARHLDTFVGANKLWLDYLKTLRDN